MCPTIIYVHIHVPGVYTFICDCLSKTHVVHIKTAFVLLLQVIALSMPSTNVNQPPLLDGKISTEILVATATTVNWKSLWLSNVVVKVILWVILDGITIPTMSLPAPTHPSSAHPTYLPLAILS